LLGFDIMLDSNLKPWIIEVNQSPSLSTDLIVDLEVKGKLIEETLKLLNLAQSKENSYFWTIYPTKNSSKFKKLFCFPFPEELLNGDFLDSTTISDLMLAVRK